MRPDLLDSLTRRGALHVIWLFGHERECASWLYSLAQSLESVGSVCIVDLTRTITVDRPGAPSLLDVRIHQGQVDRKDDLTLPWQGKIHLLPLGFLSLPDSLDSQRLRNLLVNLQLVREGFAVTLVVVGGDWRSTYTSLAQTASSVLLHPLESLRQDAKQQLRGASLRCPVVESSPQISLVADTLMEARRFHILQQNPPELGRRLFMRFWWLLGLVLMALFLGWPKQLESPISFLRDLEAEKRQYTGKPFLQHRFKGDETLQRLGKHAIGRYTALVPSETELREYIQETIKRNQADTTGWRRDGRLMIPREGTLLRFYAPERLYNPDAASQIPAWRFFVSLLSDSLAYVTEYYDPEGKIGRRHNGIDIAGRKGTRILAPFEGKAYTTQDERGGVVIALVGKSDVLLFMHCDQLLYMDGQDVYAGDPLATVGMTGHTTGPHVHLVVGKVGTSGQSAGPIRYKTQDPVRWVIEDWPRLSKLLGK